MTIVAAAEQPDPYIDLARAALRVGLSWQLSVDEFQSILGVPPASLAGCQLEGPAMNQAGRLLALFTELGSRLGVNDAAAMRWLRTPNAELDGDVPIEVMHTRSGLKEVLAAAAWARPTK